MTTHPVYPSLNELIRLAETAKGLPLTLSAARAFRSGSYLSCLKGRGMEFDETRPYTPGDDIRHLDWQVTARTGKPYTKQFREERERPVFITVDYRATMFFGTQGMFKSALAAQLTTLIAWGIHNHGDRVGGQIFSENKSVEWKPEHGQRSVLRLLRALTDYTSNTPGTHLSDVYSSEKVLEEALKRLPKHARPGSVAIVLSDFRSLNASGEAALYRLAHHSDGVLLFLYDPLEQSLPLGRYTYMQGQRNVGLETTVRMIEKHTERFQERYERVQQLARRCRFRFFSCATVEEPLSILQKMSTIR